MKLNLDTKFDVDTNTIVLLTMAVVVAGLFILTIARISKK